MRDKTYTRAVCRLEGVSNEIGFVSVVERGDRELEFVRDLSGGQSIPRYDVHLIGTHSDEIVEVDRFVAVRMDLRRRES